MEKHAVKLKDDERIDQLYSQDVQIIQSPSCFAFSLDAVLLADFVRPNYREKLQIVDLCAGNGAVGLFLHNKLGGHFTEVELQERIADMAQRTIELNDLTDRYRVLNIDIADVFDHIKKDSADVVLCNPPYFPVTEKSQKNPNQHLAIARHEIRTNIEMVAEQMSGLLKMNGHGYLVHRPDRVSEILSTLENHRLVPKRIRFIYPKPDRDANIMLIEVIKDGKPGGQKIVPSLIVNDDQGNYLPEVRKLLYGDGE
ncbi:MAG: tRNA1(Val) (adenine(37)-N6)-methyltransferase [Limosilactobacillus sp.]|uniref:tRNA1(Val) (adenine(37)-N6)-methyltransferase n=1 Tax=Limosilactobacillus sp. TaxID=2773925 RepID=UPI00270D4C21|nr:tRNA1(Val) (adenine(37)-N6)-methyltransferase [Limosilactobacillus sp.]